MRSSVCLIWTTLVLAGGVLANIVNETALGELPECVVGCHSCDTWVDMFANQIFAENMLDQGATHACLYYREALLL